MVITLDFTTLTATVKRSLSIIAKRSRDDNGNLLFKDITLGSLEEPILPDFYKQAIIHLKTQTDQFSSSTSDTSITLTFPTSHPTGNDTTIQDTFEQYCIAYALYSWFQVVAPRLVTKYKADADTLMLSLIRLVFAKQPPVTHY